MKQLFYICILTVAYSNAFKFSDLFGGSSKKVQSPTTGPCVLNNDGMKCTQHGYYEIVQCNEESCFCVTAHTGFVSYDTTTSNNKTAPHCGPCLVYLQKLFSVGDAPENSFVPKCDVAEGNFEPVQCDSKSNICYCVDTTTGREITGSRRPLSNTQKMNCDRVDFSIDASGFQSFEKSEKPTTVESPVGREYCRLDRDAGHTCRENKTGVKYFFDVHTFQCLAFEHKGCGGNENVFRTKSDCLSACVLMDYFSCGLQTQPARKSNGQTYLCGNSIPQLPPSMTTIAPRGPEMNKDGCPKGFTCLNGAFFGFCCNAATENRFRAAFGPHCSNGAKALHSRDNGYDEYLFGKSCRDNFCPNNHSCESNDIFAFCCSK